jgi:hypothetical protein
VENFGDLLGGLGDILGGLFDNGEAAEGVMGLTDLFAPDGRRRAEPAAPIVYERFLCGAPRRLHLNDR